MLFRGEMSKRISHAFAVTERKENRTLREKGVRVDACATLRLARSSSYGAPTRHTSATLDFKEWRRVFVFLWRFLLTSLCRTRLALTLLWSTRLILTIYAPDFLPENRAFIVYTLLYIVKFGYGWQAVSHGCTTKNGILSQKISGHRGRL